MAQKQQNNQNIQNQQPHDNVEDRRSIIFRHIVTFLAILGILLALWLITKLSAVVVLVLISIVLATGLAPAVVWLENINFPRGWHMPRSLAILLVYLFAVFVVLGAAAIILVPAIRESINFWQNLPRYTDQLQDLVADLRDRYTWIPDYAGLLDRARQQLSAIGGYLISSARAAFGVLGGLVSIVTVLVITYYILATFEKIREGFVSLLPPKDTEKAEDVLHKMAFAMGGWLRGQLLLAALVGIAIAIGMYLLQVPYPFVIAVVGAVGEIVPMVGPFVAAIPAILLTILGPTWQLIAVIAFFLILSQVEGNYLAPRIMQKQVGLTPLITVIALLAGGTLYGIVGALLAIPIAAALQVLFVEVVAPAIRNWEKRD